MEKLFLFFTLLLLTTLSYAQKPVWAFAHNGAQSSGNGVAVDASGNIYQTGSFSGTVDFDPGPGSVNLSSNGNDDIFICKFDASGNLLWAKSVGSAQYDGADYCFLHSNGSILISGQFRGTIDFDPNAGSSVQNVVGSGDGFLLCLDANGNFNWVKTFGGSGSYVNVFCVKEAPDGTIGVSGWFDQTVDFDSGTGTYNLSSAGGYDGYVLKTDASGNFLNAVNFGGTSGDFIQAHDIDAKGNYILTGLFNASCDMDPGAGNYTLTGGSAAVFISKLNPQLNFKWAYCLQNTGSSDGGYDVDTDTSGNIYTTGTFTGLCDFDPGSGVFNLTGNGMYISKSDSSGNFIWAKQIGAGNANVGRRLRTDISGKVYVYARIFGTVDLDPGPATHYISTLGPSVDMAVIKLDSGGNYEWSINMGGTSTENTNGFEITNSGNVYITGWSASSMVDFNGGPGLNYVNFSSPSAFLAKYCPAQIDGTVFYSGGAVNNGFARLYHNTFGKHMELIDSVQINSAGQFNFYNIPDDTMTVYVRSNTLNTIGTYFGDTCAWIPGDSGIIYCGVNNMAITLDELVPMAGNGSANGYVVEGINFGKLNMNAAVTPGNPVGGIDVGVRKKPAGTVAGMTQTDASGYYSLNNLDPGNYTLYVDIPGLPMDSSYDFTITGNETFSNLDFTADSAKIYIGNYTGIHESGKDELQLTVYPNPAENEINIVFNQHTVAEKIRLMDMSGRKVLETNATKQVIDVSGIARGMYILEVSAAEAKYLRRVVIR